MKTEQFISKTGAGSAWMNVPLGRTLCVLALAAAAVLAAPAVQAQGAVVWDGPTISFNNAAGSDPTLAANQDRLTSDVWITRGGSEGIYNAAVENGYTKFTSPAGTEWAYGSLANYASLPYTTWAGMNGHNPPSMVGQSAVEHLIADNIYLAVTFTSWGGAGGGFAYTRSTPPVPEPSSAALGVFGVLMFAGIRSVRKQSWRSSGAQK